MHVDVAHAAVDRQDRPRRVRPRHRPDLAGRGAIERPSARSDRRCERDPPSAGGRSRRRRTSPCTISRSAPIDVTWLRGLHELVGIVRQQVEVQAVLRELLLVEIALARADRDVARRLLSSGSVRGSNVHRHARQTGREAGLAGRRRVGREAVEAARSDAPAIDVRLHLRVVHRVAAADRQCASRRPDASRSRARGAKFVRRVVSVCRS